MEDLSSLEGVMVSASAPCDDGDLDLLGEEMMTFTEELESDLAMWLDRVLAPVSAAASVGQQDLAAFAQAESNNTAIVGGAPANTYDIDDETSFTIPTGAASELGY
jgi:hypothetical protein